ncbi:MAG: hypothetical protein UR66_C0004G0088 [Candidatus Moranbacteria bacterium GW2011_GWE1_35_17]|nr:MAG: hypothetical protein UR66_C0004G0088 [Candidatus Moranbacteria bacterium GW2011_GWE1_35_17]KKP84657.1 MAG: hypothetical protein UR82_C0001G0024 [Candidatus Moranbacteria bacterium GW2011_GWF1_35_5]
MLKNILSKPIIIYALLKNILIIFLVIWAFALLGEAFLPGFVSTNISFLKLTLLIFGVIFSIYLVSKKIETPESMPMEIPKFTLFTTIFFVIIISGLALLKFNYFSNITITLTTLLILFYFYKELLNKKE